MEADMNFGRHMARKRPWAVIGAASLLVAIGGAGALALASPALAQSPTPHARMWMMYPGGSWPGTDATVIEGLGMGNCSYSVSQVEDATVSQLDAGHNTITEVSPQNGDDGGACASRSGYKTMLTDINSYVEDHASNASTDWGGFMLDEETGWGFTATQYEILNGNVASIMDNDPGVSWYFTENAPEQWSVSTYDALAGSSWLAPQIYNTSDADNANAACNDYELCTNAVSIWSQLAAPWDELDYVTGLIDGTPWNAAGWDSGAHFANIFV
jgi:hypothetical protein